jgi:hypothetical protein
MSVDKKAKETVTAILKMISYSEDENSYFREGSIEGLSFRSNLEKLHGVVNALVKRLRY